MKIFNYENGKEKVYVQMQDLMVLIHEDINCGIPGSIFEKVFLGSVNNGQTSGMLIVDDSNRWEFKEFDLPEEVEFFKKLDWIVDYKEHRNKSREELIAYGRTIEERINQVVDIWNNMTNEEQKKHGELYNEYSLLKYQGDFLPNILWLNQGHITMPFPLVADSDGVVLQDNMEYEAKTTLDPNKVIIYRKDGQPINKGKVDKDFIKYVITNSVTILNQTRGDLCTFKNAKHNVSPDGRVIEVTLGIKPILSQEEKDYKKQNSFVRRMVRKITGSQE